MARRTTKVPDLLTWVCDANLCNLAVSDAQEVLIRTIDGLSLRDKKQEDIFRYCTGLPHYVPRRRLDVTVIAGVRSGKESRIIAPLIMREAVTRNHAAYLAPGERSWHVLVAQGMRGAVDVSFGYIVGLFDQSKMLGSMVTDPKQFELHLSNRAVITAFPCTRTAPLGYTIGSAGLSEFGAFKSDTGANVDRVILANIKRGTATVPGAPVIRASVPYSRTGELWKDYQTCFGAEDGPTLVWKAESALMNPTLDPAFLREEERRDPELYRQNYLAEFIDTVAAFLSDGVVGGSVVTGRRELPPVDGIVYASFADPAGGTSGGDSFGLAFGHLGAEGRIVLDCLRRWRPPFNPTSVVVECADLLKSYRCHAVVGDRFAGGFVRDAFARCGIEYVSAEKDKSTLYHELLPRMNAGQVELLDMPELLRELRSLERRKGAAGGRDRVDHAPGQHDDLANVVAGVVMQLTGDRPRKCCWCGGNCGLFCEYTPSREASDDAAETAKAASTNTIEAAIRAQGVWWPGEGASSRGDMGEDFWTRFRGGGD